MKASMSYIKYILCLIVIGCSLNHYSKQIFKIERLTLNSFDFLMDGGSAMWGFKTDKETSLFIVARIFTDSVDNERIIELMWDAKTYSDDSFTIKHGSQIERKLLQLISKSEITKGKDFAPEHLMILKELISDRRRGWPEFSEWPKREEP